MMLTPSRFQAEMTNWGLASKRVSPDGLPVIHLRDPGRSLAESPVAPGEQPAIWPQTLLVRTVVAAREAREPKGYGGTIARPYRDYRGEPVVASWRWLAELGVGFATEVDAREVAATANIVDKALLSLLACLAVAGAWTVVSSGWLIGLRGEVDRGTFSQMGAYSLIEKIGEGGIGEVYLARHTLLKRTAALKLLRRDRSDEDSFTKFESEVTGPDECRWCLLRDFVLLVKLR